MSKVPSSRVAKVDEVGDRMCHELLGQLAYREQSFATNPLSATQLGDIIDAVGQGVITGKSSATWLDHRI